MPPISAQRCCILAAGLSLLLMTQGCGVTYLDPQAAPPTVAPAPAPTPAPAPAPVPSPALSRVVFLGDSLTAGAQNYNLVDTAQAHSFPAVLAAQAGFSLVQALIPAPGYDGGEALTSSTFPFGVHQLSGGGLNRENPSVQATNLSVPEVTTHGLLTLTPSANGGNGLVNIALGYPAGNNGTQLSEAIALNPTTIFLWIGANDIAPSLFTGDPASMTSLAGFTADFTTILTTLKGRTKATLIVANLPDATLSATLTAAPLLAQQVAGVTGADAGAVEAALGLEDGDFVIQAGVTAVVTELPSIKAGTLPPPLPPNQVLTAAEAAAVRERTLQFNQVIAQQVSAAGGTLIDLYSYFNSLKNGLPVDGTILTLDYLGGFYSLDGLHPTSTGYALIANEYISALNAAGLGVSIATIDVSAVAAQDPLFHPAPSLRSAPFQPAAHTLLAPIGKAGASF